MAKSLLSKFIEFSAQEYNTFFNLPLKIRLRAVYAFSLFFICLITITHVIFRPYLNDTASARYFIFGFYFFFFVGMSSTSIFPILFPKVRKYLKTIVIAELIFGFIIGIVISILEQNSEIGWPFLRVIFYAEPGTASYLFWYLGVFSLVFGMQIMVKVLKVFYMEKAVVDTEIRLAHKIQSRLTPELRINENSFELYGKTIPANEIGGDYFDFIRLPEGRIALSIGDVSGHDISAGLLMGITKSAFFTEMKYNHRSKDLFSSLNETIYNLSDKMMFVSFASMIFDFQTNNLTYSNAGHMPVTHYDNEEKKVKQIYHKALALGISPNIEFKEEIIPFRKNDLFLLYTDGISEAITENGKSIDSDILSGIFLNDSNIPLSQIGEHIFKNTDRPNDQKINNDDRTILIIRIK